MALATVALVVLAKLWQSSSLTLKAHVFELLVFGLKMYWVIAKLTRTRAYQDTEGTGCTLTDEELEVPGRELPYQLL